MLNMQNVQENPIVAQDQKTYNDLEPQEDCMSVISSLTDVQFATSIHVDEVRC